MKKLILSCLLLASTFFLKAQQKVDTAVVKNSGSSGNNELKLNLAYTIGGFPELNYERILKDDMSVGIAVMLGIEDDPEFNFGVIPNFRIYFGGKKANGFFIEGNAAIISSDNYDSYYSYNDVSNTYTYYGKKTQTNFGLGAAAGAKFLTKNGFVGEVYLGAGRLFGSNNADAYPRAGITIGKRF